MERNAYLQIPIVLKSRTVNIPLRIHTVVKAVKAYSRGNTVARLLLLLLLLLIAVSFSFVAFVFILNH